MIRTPPRVRRMIYGPPPEGGDRRGRVRDEAMEFYSTFQADFSQLNAAFGGVDVSDWELSADLQPAVAREAAQ